MCRRDKSKPASSWIPKALRSPWLWVSVFTSMLPWLIQQLFPDFDLVLLLLSPCAWPVISNGVAYNVGLPDLRSMYYFMTLKLGPGDEVMIKGESLPYARYASFQTYALYNMSLMPQTSIRDYEIVVSNGSNAYSNLTAALLGEPLGGYTVYVTADGKRGYTNELRGLEGGESGYAIVAYRVYVEDEPEPPRQAPWAHKEPLAAPDFASEWGWTPPPRVWFKDSRSKNPDQWREVAVCKRRRRHAPWWVKYLVDYAPRLHPVAQARGRVNEPDNMFLSTHSERTGFFASYDADYMISSGDIAKLPAEHPQLYARVTGVLARTSRGLYKPPYIANFTDYKVRYASLSTGEGSIPYRVFETASDNSLRMFYEEKLGAPWDGRYVIWGVPPDTDPKDYPPEIGKEELPAYILEWGRSVYSNTTVRFSGVMLRQVLPQEIVMPELGQDQSAISNVVPNACESDEGSVAAREAATELLQRGDTAAVRSNFTLMEAICCGPADYEFCYEPSYVLHRMKEYYPRVTYYARAPDGPLVLVES